MLNPNYGTAGHHLGDEVIAVALTLQNAVAPSRADVEFAFIRVD